MRSHLLPVEIHGTGNNLSHGVYHTGVESSNTVIHNFRNRSTAMRDDGTTARHRFDHHEPKRFIPLNGEDQCRGTAKQLILLRVIHRSDPPHVLTVDQRLHFLREVSLLLASLWATGEYDRHANSLSDPDSVPRILTV